MENRRLAEIDLSIVGMNSCKVSRMVSLAAGTNSTKIAAPS